jgi:hypothetical protein
MPAGTHVTLAVPSDASQACSATGGKPVGNQLRGSVPVGVSRLAMPSGRRCVGLTRRMLITHDEHSLWQPVR